MTYRDGNPHDRFFIRHSGCAVLVGELEIDLHSSRGEVLIDTVRGGPGTKDPMPVDVERGPVLVDPVEDGAKILRVSILGLEPGKLAAITLDLDAETHWWPAPRVAVEGDEIAQSEARLALLAQGYAGVFDTTGGVRFSVPSLSDCAETNEEEEPALVPIS
ncbi:MAG: hypothetical protein AAF330_07645 [Pseudomonadota bacterium]